MLSTLPNYNNYRTYHTHVTQIYGVGEEKKE